MEDIKNEEKETLSGTVEHIIYSNEDNGYTIMDIENAEDGNIETVVGILPYIGEGETLVMYGKWVHNPKYGRQFSVESYEKKMPTDESSILRYLASGAVKGIGPKTAMKVVEKFGVDSFNVIENHSEWLADIQGISIKKAIEIGENFKRGAGMRNTMIFFREYFGVALVMKIYKQWGSSSVDVVKENPYLLCEYIDGIGFEKADEFAEKIGFSNDGTERVVSGIVYILKSVITKNGHICLPLDKLVPYASQLLCVSEEKIKEGIAICYAREKLVGVTYDDRKLIYEMQNYKEEKYIAQKLIALDKMANTFSLDEMNSLIEIEEKKSNIELAPLQKRAIYSAIEHGVMVLTGGPGTGKTTVVKAIIGVFEALGLEVALTAPTGRASNRLSESTNREAKTIHRLLEMDASDGERGRFFRNEDNKLNEQVIIVDEASMVDCHIMYSLLSAIKNGARLIIIGDSDQLASVGAGDVLRDIINSKRFETIRLHEIFRQARESLIVTNAHEINDGNMPILNVKDKDFFFIPRDSEKAIAQTVSELYYSRLPKAYPQYANGGIQVISPSRKGEAGCDNLNVCLQNMLNPPKFGKTEYKYRQTVFRVGDRVMQIKNNYSIEWEKSDKTDGMGIFNGDIGIIENISLNNQTMTISFEQRKVEYDFSLLDELELSYCITVHKSQGSEYPVVIIPLCNCSEMLLTRNMIYTAITRAQKMVVLVGSEETIKKMVNNNKLSLRYTGLQILLEK